MNAAFELCYEFVYICKSKAESFNIVTISSGYTEKFFEDLKVLYELCYDNSEHIREAVVDMVDTYRFKKN